MMVANVESRAPSRVIDKKWNEVTPQIWGEALNPQSDECGYERKTDS